MVIDSHTLAKIDVDFPPNNNLIYSLYLYALHGQINFDELKKR